MTESRVMPTVERKSSPRLEALTDSAFAFALTLLVIASGPPRSFEDLAQALKTVPAFVASATLLLMFWQGHVSWSRRFGVDDAKSVVLTCGLIFTVLIYVYPLRLIAAGFFHWISGGWLNANFTSFHLADLRLMFLVYGLGFMAMCFSLVLLYRHSFARADFLGLDTLERFDARTSSFTYSLLAGSGLLSILICLLPGKLALAAGWAYVPLGFVMPLWGRRNGREREKLRQRLEREEPGEP